MKLTKKQDKIVQGVLTHILDPNKRSSLVIDMISGSGKTTVIHHIMSNFSKYLNEYKTILPKDTVEETYHLYYTVTLKKLIDETAPIINSITSTTNVRIKSVRTIYSLANLVVSYGKLIATKQKSKFNGVKGHIVIFIDEAGLLVERDMLLIQRQLKRLIGRNTYSIILLGDKHQLIAWRENEAYIYSKHFDKQKVLTNNIVRRHPDKDFCKYIQRLRKNVKKKIITPIPNLPHIHKLSGKKFAKEMLKAVKEDDPLIITYSNKRAMKITNYIKKELKLKNDEVAMINDLFTFNGSKFIEKNIVPFKVPTEGKLKYNVADTLYVIYKNKTEYTKSIKTFLHTMNENLKYYKSQSVTNVRVGYVVSSLVHTVHYIQGQTNKKVFFDLRDPALTYMDFDTFSRFLYVAISRSSDQVYINGDIPMRFLNVYS